MWFRVGVSAFKFSRGFRPIRVVCASVGHENKDTCQKLTNLPKVDESDTRQKLTNQYQRSVPAVSTLLKTFVSKSIDLLLQNISFRAANR